MTYDHSYRDIAAYVRTLHPSLVEHIHRVRLEARALAKRFQLDDDRVDVAALAHDIARLTAAAELRRLASAYALPIHPVEEDLPILLHGPVGAAWIQRRFAIDDPEILDAVRWHSTATRGLSALGKAVFLADKLDRDKAGRYPFQAEVRRLAQEDLDAAVLHFLNQEMMSFLARDGIVHPASLEARNELLAKRRRTTDPPTPRS